MTDCTVTGPLPARAELIGTIGTGFAIQVITFLAGVLTARLLGPEGRGLLAGAILWPSLLAAVATLGTPQMLSLRAAVPNVDRNELVGRGMGLAIMLGGLGVVVGWLLLPLLVPDQDPEMLTLGRLFLLFIPLNVLVTQLQAIDLGRRSIRRLNMTRLLIAPVQLTFVCVLWVLTLAEALYFVIGQLVANAITLAWRWSKEPAACVRPCFDARWMRELIRDSRQFFLTNLGYLLQTQFDRVFVLWILPVADLGIYVVALGCAGVHLIVTRSLGLVVFARGAGMELQEAIGDFSSLFRRAVVVSALLSVAIVVLLPIAVPVLFGKSFTGAAFPAIVLVFGNLFGSLASLCDEALRAQAKPVPGFQGRLLGSGIFLGLAVILNRDFGLIGIASAAAVGQAAFLVWMVGRMRKISTIILAPRWADVTNVANELVVLVRTRASTGRPSA